MLALQGCEGIKLERQHGSTLEPERREAGEEKSGMDQPRELGVIEFLAQQLSPENKPVAWSEHCCPSDKWRLDGDDNDDEEEEEEEGTGLESEAEIKRGWTEHEESLLIRLAEQHGRRKSKWKLIAQSMPDPRTPGQVREKWLRMQREGKIAAACSPSQGSMISALRHAARQQASSGQACQTERVVAGQPRVMTPQCHRCHHRKPGRGWASCENGLAHHFCDRCVHNSFATDFADLIADPSLWCCPVCNGSCPCAACERRSQQHKPGCKAQSVCSTHPSPKGSTAFPKIKKGWSDADASLLVALVHQHRSHKNKWKLVAAAMPDARTPGQVKEKFHRMQKLPEFGRMMKAAASQPPTTSSPVLTQSGATDATNDSLTLASAEDGALNLMTSHKSASGFRGVSRAGSRWEAYIGNGTSGKRYIGRFDTPREAAIAYAEAYTKQPAGSSPQLAPREAGKSPKLSPRLPKRSLPCSPEEEPELVRSSKAASGYMGVSRAGCRWEAYVSAGKRGKRFKRYIGCYDTPELAAKAYLDATSNPGLKEDDGQESEDDNSQEWFSDECENARSLPSLATAARETPPSLQLPPASNPESAQAVSSLLLEASKQEI